MKIDIGGLKNRNTMGGEWKIMDCVIHPAVDIVFNLNVHYVFPLEDASVDYYYMSHTLEHVKPKRIPIILEEIYRTLKKGGIFRVIVPDFERLLHLYFYEPERLFKKGLPQGPEWYPQTKLGKVLAWMQTPDTYVKGAFNRSGHKMIFDYETLTYYLRNAGFENTYRTAFNECVEAFIGKDLSTHKSKSIYVEAEK
jgi:predicted SAM-dependent methyltransferase